MNKSILNKNIWSILNKSFINLPTPININIWWNFGSMLGINLMIQIISGLFLSMHYCPNTLLAFNSILHIMIDVKYGWIMRYMHLNGASTFFICMYFHIGRNMYYQSYKLMLTWFMGILILLMSMATAFLGYVLPWGQMSYWGATVITNLISAIPYLGNMIVLWIWGGFSINNATLNRFFSFHFILPFIILLLVIFHLTFLHMNGSNNPLGVNSNYYKIPFHIYFSIKDLLGFLMLFNMLLLMVMINPNMLNDPDNFNEANPMITPIHIQPEWYFLFAYAILRSIPNKLGGVIALLMSIMILFIMPLNHKNKMNSTSFYPINQMYFWMFISTFIVLTWTGSMPIEYPYYFISQINSILYFSFFMLNPMIMKMWDNLMKNQI